MIMNDELLGVYFIVCACWAPCTSACTLRADRCLFVYFKLALSWLLVTAVRLNELGGVFYICSENLSMWEKIACGEVEDVVPSPPYDSGPVKVDNWLPKSLLARQRNTTCTLPRTSYSVGGWTHIPRCRDTDQLKATWLKTQLPHRVTEVSTLMVSPTPETNGLSTGGGGLNPITLHPHSLRIHLVEWTLVFFYVLFF